MHPLITIFWASLVLSVLAFLLFAAFAVQRYIQLRGLAAHLGNVTPARQNRGMDTGLQSLPDVDKILEALAKLTDSLAKAPMSVAALIASLFFMLVAFGS